MVVILVCVGSVVGALMRGMFWMGGSWGDGGRDRWSGEALI